jgi:hypothetical protein
MLVLVVHIGPTVANAASLSLSLSPRYLLSDDVVVVVVVVVVAVVFRMFSESGLHQRSEREQFIRKDEKDHPEVRRRSYACDTLVAWHVTQCVTQALVTG